METVKKILAMVLVLMPMTVRAGTDCHYVEYPDHFDAVCIGDEKPLPVASRALAKSSELPTVKEAQKVKETTSRNGPLAGNGAVTGKPSIAAKASATVQGTDKAEVAAEHATSRAQRSEPAAGKGKHTAATGDAKASPYLIGLRRPDNVVRNAARATRARLILEERQKQQASQQPAADLSVMNTMQTPSLFQ